MYQDVKRTCRVIVLNLLFINVLVSAVVVVYVTPNLYIEFLSRRM